MAGRIAVFYRNPKKLTPYADAARLASLVPAPIAPGECCSIEDYSGFLFTGGTDIDTELYGQLKYPSTQIPDRERDDFEIAMLRAAVRHDKPVLAICRGLQLLNVAFGGSLIQDLPDSGISHQVPVGRDADPGRHPAVHNVEIDSHGQIASIYGTGVHKVNSRHHQAVDRLGQGLVVVARAADGVVEACEMPARSFVVGVQWHPEDRVLDFPEDRALFEAFARAAQRP